MSFVVVLSLFWNFLAPLTDADWHQAANKQSFTVTSVKKPGSLQYFAKKPWEGLFSAKKFLNTDQPELLNIKQTLQASIVDLPTTHTQALKTLEVRKQQHASRGLANSQTVILNTDSISSTQELQAVFTHEMGHVVDLGVFKTESLTKSPYWMEGTKVYWGDPSIAFYRLSWVDYKTKQDGAERKDFISGYAMSSPFEDFAETYVFYRLHGEKFRAILDHSNVLAAKYEFMKESVFNGQEYQLDKASEGFVHNVLWDATLVKF